MKRWMVVTSALTLLLTAAACAQDEPAAASAPAPAAETAAVIVSVSTAALTPEPSAEPTEEPLPEGKATLAIDALANASYTATLPGDRFSGSTDESIYMIDQEVSPAKISLTVRDGFVQLYCDESVVANATILGLKTPASPTYVRSVKGTLPLSQIDEATLRAEGDLTAPGEGPYVYWDKNKKFTKWKIEEKDYTYHCTVTIAFTEGVPTAELTVAGTDTSRTISVPLRLKSQVQTVENAQVLWTNGNTVDVKNKAKDYYVKFDLPDCTVTELETYHYKSGGKEPGELMLYGDDGSGYGPFQAVGREGQDGVKNAYWAAEVNIDLPAGSYAIADSDPDTWSNNAETDGYGIAAVRGYCMGQDAAQASAPAAQTIENVQIPVELSWSTGTILYTGTVDAAGLPDGEGAGVMEADAEGNAWTYAGGWEHGHLSGTGELTHTTEGYVQSGTFLNDDLTFGSQTQDGVLRYEGEWLEGDLHGQGKLYTRAGGLLYEGRFDHNQLAETQEERERRAAPLMENCDDMNETLYAKWKDGKQAPGSAVTVRGSIVGLSEQAATGTMIINMRGNSKYPVALSYRYSTDEAKMTAKSGDISAWGYCVGTFSYTIDGKPASCPQIEVVYWTAK